MDDQREWAEANEIATRLYHLARSIRERLAEGLRLPHDLRHVNAEELEVTDLLVCLDEGHRIDQFQRLLAELDNLLKASGFAMEPPQLEEGEFWSVGSIELRHEARPIYGGFLEPALHRPLVIPFLEHAIAYLISINGEKDLLQRDHHDSVRWHYHYLDWKERRSDVILCWDIRASLVGQQPRPLFSERHGEGRKEFTARPDLWGLTKRASMHDACAPDLNKWALGEFRPPANKAVAVWPSTAVLTTAPAAPPPASPQFPSKRRANGRR